jgi:hypothetical protein
MKHAFILVTTVHRTTCHNHQFNNCIAPPASTINPTTVHRTTCHQHQFNNCASQPSSPTPLPTFE